MACCEAIICNHYTPLLFIFVPVGDRELILHFIVKGSKVQSRVGGREERETEPMMEGMARHRHDTLISKRCIVLWFLEQLFQTIREKSSSITHQASYVKYYGNDWITLHNWTRCFYLFFFYLFPTKFILKSQRQGTQTERQSVLYSSGSHGMVLGERGRGKRGEGREWNVWGPWRYLHTAHFPNLTSFFWWKNLQIYCSFSERESLPLTSKRYGWIWYPRPGVANLQLQSHVRLFRS